MRLLSIDSSGLVATIAVVEDDIMRAEYTMNYKKTHSQTLLPMIDEAASMIELELETIDAIAVAGGPGSFTGLRIGSATAKGLGLALEKPIISVSTVVGLAYNYYGYDKIICPIMDARRNQVYTGVYGFDGDRLITYRKQSAISIDELLEQLTEVVQNKQQESADNISCNSEIVFLGDGVPVQREYIDEHLKLPHVYAPAHMNGQRAGALGTCAMQMWKRYQETSEPEGNLPFHDVESDGRIELAAEHRPDYLRLSQAERERAEAQA